MKRLLVIGVREADHPFAAAARREDYEIVTDCQEAAAQGDNADWHVLVDSDDCDAVIRAAQQHSVSGILGVGEKASLTAAYAARQLELPGVPYAEERLFHNLLLLRSFQHTHQFKIPEYRDISMSTDVEGLHWPLYVSPADGNLLTHVRIAYNRRELLSARREALRHSPGGFVIAQERPGGQHPQEGEVVLCGMLVVREGEMQQILWSRCVPRKDVTEDILSYGQFPARISGSSRILLYGECKRLVSLLQLQNAEIPVIAYTAPGTRPYILQLGLHDDARLITWFWSKLYQHDFMRDVVRRAAGDTAAPGTLRMPGVETCLAWYRIYTRRHGILRHLGFHDSLDSYFVEYRPIAQQSAHLYGTAGECHILGTLLLHFSDHNVMEQVIRQIDSYIDLQIDDFDESC